MAKCVAAFACIKCSNEGSFYSIDRIMDGFVIPKGKDTVPFYLFMEWRGSSGEKIPFTIRATSPGGEVQSANNEISIGKGETLQRVCTIQEGIRFSETGFYTLDILRGNEVDYSIRLTIAKEINPPIF